MYKINIFCAALLFNLGRFLKIQETQKICFFSPSILPPLYRHHLLFRLLN